MAFCSHSWKTKGISTFVCVEGLPGCVPVTYGFVFQSAPELTAALGDVCHLAAGVILLDLFAVLVEPQHVGWQRTLRALSTHVCFCFWLVCSFNGNKVALLSSCCQGRELKVKCLVGLTDRLDQQLNRSSKLEAKIKVVSTAYSLMKNSNL